MASHRVLINRLQKRMDELEALDPAHKFGGKARAKAASKKDASDAGDVGSTKLNPDPQNPENPEAV